MKNYTSKEVAEIVRSFSVPQVPHLKHVVNEAVEKVINDNELEPLGFIDGELYKHEDGYLIVYRGDCNGYGFNSDLGYETSTDWSFRLFPNKWKSATQEDKEEFKELMIKHAIKKGLVKGAHFKSIWSGDKKFSKNGVYTLNLYGDVLLDDGIIFKANTQKWATPIKEEVKESKLCWNDDKQADEKYSGLSFKDTIIKDDQSLKSIAINTSHPLREVKELFRKVGDVEKLSKIIQTAKGFDCSPHQVIDILNSFKNK
jgi:hypothetical protein